MAELTKRFVLGRETKNYHVYEDPTPVEDAETANHPLAILRKVYVKRGAFAETPAAVDVVVRPAA